MTSFLEAALSNTDPQPGKKLLLTIPADAIADAIAGSGPGNRGNTVAGVNVPPDMGWTACTITKGTGTLEARMIAGIVYLRGTVKVAGTTSGTFTQVSSLPEGFIGPDYGLVLPVHAIDTGTAYRIGEVRLDPSGAIGVAATSGKMDTIYFDGVQFTIY